MFVEAIESILQDACTPTVVRAIEGGADPRGLWATIEDAGFLELLVPEQSGGAGLTLSELAPVLIAMGRQPLPVPLAQSVAARALLRRARLGVPNGMITLAQAGMREADGGVVCPVTPYGAIADHVVLGLDGKVLLLDAGAASRVATGVHRDQAATLRWPAQAVPEPVAAPGADVGAWGAALHAALIAGAARRVFDLTLQYCNDRTQFGRAIGKFQAVQHQLSVMAELVAACHIAAQIGLSGDGDQPDRLPAAIAKSRTSEAAAAIAATAHALHGAIGITEEYDLQLLTRRLHQWRMAHGSEAFWQPVVGAACLASAHATVDFIRAVTDSRAP
ncbi:acyl-CoA dehydrogenase family protein [Cupriavidus gilardii]|nr:acyl-CoA dehydrogenase [Cupriavidus gilardii]ALD93081.1 acyl-CoA dehydrogenase [Cupriavidus gilardii CR3]KAB0599505.1 acyl-CoA dehydrogenase [Cupriavidus gilardii]MCT9012986.1 acyl-CoA dehydrogenase family protein [Cupriavidus gilardii]MCT9052540.1 acyl-CoA dehydrogenase family protein [Cupriavidus gilardii]MCT9115514.1 acyl-CoA dehydrogenase family protein [Cupriavidus gilardii]